MSPRLCRLMPALVFLLACSFATAAEFTADVLMRQPGPGGMVNKGKVYIKGDLYRLDLTSANGRDRMTRFGRAGKDGTTFFSTQRRVYWLESGIPENDVVSDALLRKVADARVLGNAKFQGMSCKKMAYTRHEKNRGVETRWVSTALGVPIRFERKAQGPNRSPTLVTEYSNIKQQKVPSSLFRVPRGYNKLRR